MLIGAAEFLQKPATEHEKEEDRIRFATLKAHLAATKAFTRLCERASVWLDDHAAPCVLAREEEVGG